MRYLLAELLIWSPLLADFYILTKEQSIKMVERSSGKVDFSRLHELPVITPSKAIEAMSDDVGVNSKHFNFRTATLALQQSNVSLDEYSSVTDQGEKVAIRFGKLYLEEGMVLQLFYHNRWYAVAVGDPLKHLQHYFDNDALDAKKSYTILSDAIKAYPKDTRLSKLHAAWKQRYETKEQSERIGKIREMSHFYQQSPKPFMKMQVETEIRTFRTLFPNSSYEQELSDTLKHLE
jgi:hypothetical protein